MMYTKEQFEDYLKQTGEALDVKSFFAEDTRKEEYRPYFKSEEELNMWVSFPENMNLAVFNKLILEKYLCELESEGAIEYYDQDGATYKVRTARYDIYLRLLHFGHVAQYTINHKTNKKANYSKSMFRNAIYNNLVKFL